MVGMRLIPVSPSVHRSERNVDRPSRAAAPKATRQLDRLREGGDLIRFGGNEARRAQFEKGARRAAFRAPAFGKRASY